MAMRKGPAKLILTFTCLCAILSAPAAEDSGNIDDRIKHARAAGNIDDALTLSAEKIKSMRGDGGDTLQTADALLERAELLRSNFQFDDARNCQLEAEQIKRSIREQSSTVYHRPAITKEFAEKNGYRLENIEGWNVLMSKDLLANHAGTAEQLHELIERKLKDIVAVVPAKPLAYIRTIPIYVDYDLGLTNPTFHGGPDWLVQHHINPILAYSLSLSPASAVLGWSQDQPWMILHELSHSYHWGVLGFDNPSIKQAYQHALNTGLYVSVLDVHGTRVRAYALTNEREYFAECSEAFFGKNDFYPFVRSEFKAYDPVGYEAVKKSWGL